MESIGTCGCLQRPLIDNKDSKNVRADVLIEDYIAKLEGKIEKKSRKLPSDLGCFDKEQFVSTNPRVVGYREKAAAISVEWQSHWRQKIADVKALIEELEIVCPFSGSKTGQMSSSST